MPARLTAGHFCVPFGFAADFSVTHSKAATRVPTSTPLKPSNSHTLQWSACEKAHVSPAIIFELIMIWNPDCKQHVAHVHVSGSRKVASLHIYKASAVNAALHRLLGALCTEAN